MPVAPSFLELFQAARAEQIATRPELQVFEGDISEMLMYAATAMADKCIEFSAANFKATFLDGAAGDELTQLVNDHWALDRNEAVPAVVQVTFTRPTDTAGAGTIPAGTTIATETDPDGQSFRFTTDTALNFGPTDLVGVVGSTAEAAGIESNVVAGALTRVIDNLYDSTFTVNNVGPAVQGTDEETDEALRDRVRSFFATLNKGTLNALIFGAKTIDGVVSVAGTVDVATGTVKIFVSDINGNSTTEMVNDVQVVLDNDWKCFGTVLSVVGGTQVLQDVDYSITLKDGATFSELEPLIVDAISGTLEKLNPSETLYVSQIVCAIIGVDPDNIENVTVTTPAADVEDLLGLGNVLRAGTITGTEV